MGAITIRRLDDDLVARLKANASSLGQSLEEHARTILARSAPPRMKGGPEAEAFFAKLQKEMFGDRVLPDSTEMIREMREEDPTRWTGA